MRNNKHMERFISFLALSIVGISFSGCLSEQELAERARQTALNNFKIELCADEPSRCPESVVGETFGAFCKLIRAESTLHPEYIAAYLGTDEYRKIIMQLACGSNINNLKTEHIDNLMIPIPDDDAQQQFIAFVRQSDKSKFAALSCSNFEKRDAFPRQLSGGQKQRIAIVRALVMNPDAILFDEPTSALDPEMVGEVLSLMKDLAEGGLTMIVVTHEIAFAREVASRILFMESGRLVWDSDPEEFFGEKAQGRVRDFLSRVL